MTDRRGCFRGSGARAQLRFLKGRTAPTIALSMWLDLCSHLPISFLRGFMVTDGACKTIFATA
ncbi:hypothetical protein MTBUT4_420021 [Magnetospirillum sp. UT-4]|nr:hypothetical protein MTBUT4_420021 [Magnetospirillum sp. UT-4]